MTLGPPPSPPATLGPGREFDLIRAILAQHERIADRAGAHPAVRVVPGDDAAVIDASPLVVSADLSFEDVHFRRDWITPDEIGWRATAASLSDLAAMAAVPVGILVTMAVKPDDATAFATSVMAGASLAAVAYGAALLGGDISRSTGPFVLDVISVGHAGRPILRSGAQPGDSIWVTGSLGGAAAAVAAWSAGGAPDPAARARFAHPIPRIAEARWLAERGVLHALIDLSDGLAGDVRHLAAASNVCIRLDVSQIPIHPAANRQLAIQGGEDYELCFAAPPSFGDSLVEAFQHAFELPLTRVGSVEAGSGVLALEDDGSAHSLEAMGYSHL